MVKKQKKCPKCGKMVSSFVIKQKFETAVFGEQFSNGETTYPDITAGYTDLWEWISNMLNESGKAEILGCHICYDDE